VIEYFNGRESKLLVINLSEQDTPKKLSTFLGVKKELETMPWKNKTVSIINKSDDSTN